MLKHLHRSENDFLANDVFGGSAVDSQECVGSMAKFPIKQYFNGAPDDTFVAFLVENSLNVGECAIEIRLG